MRLLNQQLNMGPDNTLQVVATDMPPMGMPNCRYDIMGFSTVYNPAADDSSGYPAHFTRLPVIFQNGPLQEDVPQNGVTPQALLAVIADHLHGKQMGMEASPENQAAMMYVVAAMEQLNSVPLPRIVSHQPAYAQMGL